MPKKSILANRNIKKFFIKILRRLKEKAIKTSNIETPNLPNKLIKKFSLSQIIIREVTSKRRYVIKKLTTKSTSTYITKKYPLPQINYNQREGVNLSKLLFYINCFNNNIINRLITHTGAS